MRPLFLVCVFMVFVLLACPSPKPQITKRYSSIRYEPDSKAVSKPIVSIGMFSIAPSSPEKKSKSILDLSDKGQAEFIKLAAPNSKNADELKSSIFKVFEPNKSESFDRSRIRLKRRLVFSLQKENFHPADRIEESILIVKIPDSIRFVSWNQFQNRYKTITPGTLEFEQTNNTSAELALSFPQVQELGDISLAHEKARRLRETANLERDIVHFWAQLERHFARIYQKGATSIDLSGTFIIDVELGFNPDYYNSIELVKFSNLFDKSGAPISSKKIKTSVIKVYYPYNANDIPCELELNYKIRKVESGESTHVESDDEVVMIVGKTLNPKKEVIIPAENLELNIWYIVTPDGRQLKWQKRQEPGAEAISFSSFDDALNLLRWLKSVEKEPLVINEREIGIGGDLRPLDSQNTAPLSILINTIN